MSFIISHEMTNDQDCKLCLLYLLEPYFMAEDVEPFYFVLFYLFYFYFSKENITLSRQHDVMRQ